MCNVESERDMNQTPPLRRNRAALGAVYMVLAGCAFSGVNVITQKVTGGLGFKPTSDAFWQYFIALCFSLPMLLRHKLSDLRTDHPMAHIIRVALGALGVQAWVMGLSHGVPIWQAIALVMTSPFFIILGARLFLHERVGAERWIAAIVAFAGAMLILEPWTSGFNAYSLLPVLAAVLWGASSLVMKHLTAEESADTLTIWLLLLLSPINLALSAAAGFEWPQGPVLWLLLLGGLVMFIAQWCLTKAYAVADAAYVQPFDDLKLPLNVLAGWLAFGYAPEGYLWIGIAMILAASLFLLWREWSREKQNTVLTAKAA